MILAPWFFSVWVFNFTISHAAVICFITVTSWFNVYSLFRQATILRLVVPAYVP